MKNALNLTVLIAGIIYGVWLLAEMLGAIFVIGNNDTAWGVIGILAYGLIPLPASLLAVRWRRPAVVLFVSDAVLWTTGVLHNHFYLVRTFGNQPELRAVMFMLASSCALPLGFAAYFAITGILGWPAAWSSRRAGSVRQSET